MTDSVVAASRESIRKGSKSFAAASLLLPATVRDDAAMLYAWCRHCDDVIDGQTLGHLDDQGMAAAAATTPRERLAGLVAATHAALTGEPTDDPVFEAFRRVMSRHAIPERHALELLAGFAMDVDERRYDTIEDTLDYGYHVAGVVGVMMAMVMGVRDHAALDRAGDLGIAFQLTNIARDVIEDARIGRVYLPARWLAEAGVAPHEIAAPRHRAAVHALAVRLLDVAEPYYASTLVGLSALPLRCAWAIAAARRVYREIGERLRAGGPSAWEHRVSVAGSRKATLMSFAFGDALVSRATTRTHARTGLFVRPGATRPDHASTGAAFSA